MDNLELKAFIGMSRALNKINKTTNKIYQKYGLTIGQFAVLEALYHKGDLSVGEVQEKILSTSGTIPVIVKNLEKENYLIKKQDMYDKRKHILSITDKGRSLMDQVYPENEDIIVSMIGKLNKEEKENLIRYMKIIGGISDEKEDSR